jgi:hypothetical protein
MEYLDSLRAELVNAVGRKSFVLANAEGRRVRANVWRRGSLWGRRHSCLSAAALLAVLIGGGTAIADATGLIGQNLTAPAPAGVAESMPADIASAYAIARVAPTAEDALPAAAVQSLTAPGTLGVHYGVNPALSRLAGTVAGIPVWLVPGSSGSCMWVGAAAGRSGAGAICEPNAMADTQGFALIRIPVSGAASSEIGIVPDGASVTAANGDGSSAPITSSGNAFYASGDASATSVVVHSANGGTIPVGNLSTTPKTPGE